MSLMKTIVFPEGDNLKIIEATNRAKVEGVIKSILLHSDKHENCLETAARMVASGEADAMIAGIDYTSRDVILTTRDIIGMSGKTFSSSFFMEFPDGRNLVLADCAMCKNPTSEQLADIVMQTSEIAAKILKTQPMVAMLSFSTHSSGGKDPSIDKIHGALEIIKSQNPDLIVDGELQLDAAMNPEIAAKKAPNSSLRGEANVLILPDLNSGNILYKALEQLAGAKAYGPILQGFSKPVSDLSRGSTVDDVYGVISIISALIQPSQR